VNYDKIDGYLVDIFNNVVIIEEASLKNSKFNDVSLKEMHTIDVIGTHPDTTPSAVAKELMLTLGTVTTSLNKLEKKGYIVRTRSSVDRRVVHLSLSKKGRLVYRLHRRFHKSMVMRITEGFNDEELKVMSKGLENLHAAHYAPAQVVTNDDLSKIMDTSDEWIRSRTGIQERRISLNENTSDLATNVAHQLLEKSGLAPEELDFVLVATISPDSSMPSVAARVQGTIGAVNAFAFDITAACSGFVFALATAEKLIKSGVYKRGLVIGAEVLSKTLDWSDRTTAVLFGDGAGGVLLEETEEEHFLGESLNTDGSKGGLESGASAVISPYSDGWESNL